MSAVQSCILNKLLNDSICTLQEEIVQTVKQVVNTLLDDLKRVFQPLWEAPSSHRTLQTRLKDRKFVIHHTQLSFERTLVKESFKTSAFSLD